MDTILDLARLYEEIGVAVKARVSEDFSRYGMELVDFLIQAVTPPEEVQKMIDERAGMEAVGDMGRFTQYQTARAIGNVSQGGGGGSDMASMGAGMGAGVGMGAAMVEAMRGAFSGGQTGQQAQSGQPEGQGQPATGGKFCTRCGSGLPANAKFCSECGAKLGA